MLVFLFLILRLFLLFLVRSSSTFVCGSAPSFMSVSLSSSNSQQMRWFWQLYVPWIQTSYHYVLCYHYYQQSTDEMILTIIWNVSREYRPTAKPWRRAKMEKISTGLPGISISTKLKLFRWAVWFWRSVAGILPMKPAPSKATCFRQTGMKSVTCE